MLLSTAEDLAAFTGELNRESDRGLALVAAALIDDRLAETLRSFFADPASAAKLIDAGNAPLGAMSARITACHALGLIDNFEQVEIGLIRKVRNEFAHAKHGLNFDTDRIVGLCSSFQSQLPEPVEARKYSSRFRFMNATLSVVLRLYHRPAWVALERRTMKTWVDADSSRWRSFDKDPPPPGMAPILVLAQRSKAGE